MQVRKTASTRSNHSGAYPDALCFQRLASYRILSLCTVVFVVAARVRPMAAVLHQSDQVNFKIPTAAEIAQRLRPFHDLSPDAFVDPPAFIRLRGFQAETHVVETKDHYLLTMHRIINPLVPRELRDQLKPVILQHGLFTSSMNFLVNSDRNRDRPRFDARVLTRTRLVEEHPAPRTPFSWQRLVECLNDLTLARLGLTEYSDRFYAPHTSDSIAIEMANSGYDVWLTNSRGSTYSMNHTRLNARLDWRYWDFSFHEIGLYDLPAQIDYILQLRHRKSLGFVGHSQGNLAMFVLQSLQPQWADKVKPFVAMAPIAFIPDVYYGAVRFLVRILSPVVTTTSLNRVLKGQILPKSEATSQSLDLVCVPKWTTGVCNAALTLITGLNLKRANSSWTPIIAHHIPEGTSILNILHFAQMIESGRFASFDFGPQENARKYAGSQVAPDYPIERIRSRDIAFIVGRTDPLSAMRNVAITRDRLKVPLLDDHIVDDLWWGHADYAYAIGAGRQANNRIIDLCDRYRFADM